MNNFWFYTVNALIAIVLYGWLFPFLISSDDDFNVVVGVLGILADIYMMFYLIKKRVSK